jgi:hypothetical protein
MPQSTLQTVGIAAVVGAIASLATVAVVGPPADLEPIENNLLLEESSSATAAENQDLLAQLDQLAIHNQQLTERLHSLEQARLESGRQPVGEWATREELDALRKELASAGSNGGGLASTLETEQFEDQVAVAMDSIREKKAQDWVEKEAKKKAERLDQRVDEMAQWLELDASQQSQIRTVLAAKDQRGQELIAMWKNGTDKQLLGDIKKANEETWRNEVHQVLKPDQMEKFEKGPAKKWNVGGSMKKRD